MSTIETVQLWERIRALEAENAALRTPGVLTPQDAAVLLPHVNRKKPARYGVGWAKFDKIVARLETLAEGVELEECLQPFLPEHRGRQTR